MNVIEFLWLTLASMVGVLMATGLIWLIREIQLGYNRKKRWKSSK